MPSGSRFAGFTFPEALVTIGLLLLFAVLAGGLFFAARGAMERQHREGQSVLAKAALVTQLPVLCESVRPPEWANQANTFQASSQHLTVKYYEGVEDKVLSFEVANGTFLVQTPDWQGQWAGLDQISIAWWQEDSRIIGLQIHWNEVGAERSLHLPWGSRPL